MKIKLYTSLTGLHNWVSGKQMFAFTSDSSMSNAIDNIEILVDANEIESVEDNGMFFIKARGEQ